MRLDTSQQLRLGQEMKLSPRIIQAMEILQLPNLALLERIDTELQANPVLEARDPNVDEEAPMERVDEEDPRGEHDMVVRDDNGHSEDFERLAEFEDEYGPDFISQDFPVRSRPVSDGERDRKLDAMANAPAPDQSLNEYLLEQWHFVETGEEVADAGERIISHIDDDGYLRTPLEQLAADEDAPDLDTFRQALTLVQTLEPAGVGARDAQECLLLQLNVEAASGADVALEMELVRQHLRQIEQNHLPQIAKRTGRSIEEVKQALANLSHLNPRPGRLVGQRQVPVINPDVIVELDEDGNVIVSMSDGPLPRLGINRGYRRLARNRATETNAKQFLQKNIRSAQWLISAVEQRRHTIRRVTEEVFAVQREFLDQGEEALKPLPMADVAGKVGVHVATVSRAVAGKYVQTPRGIYPLRMFFSGGTTTASGEDVSWDAVKVKLREVIDSEDKKKPLSDEALAKKLKAEGIDIARRTVAKYRDLMHIPSARKRKEY
ncbi:MAG: RNA polymerase factor sigma-54 [Planctomycetota bacterium]